MKSIEEAEIRRGTKVLIRTDWNVPTNKAGQILDTSRIEISLPTIEYIKDQGGVPMVMSHFGREGQPMRPVIDSAKSSFPVLAEGVEFLENLRMDKREEENSDELAKELAGKADIYVNEAFSVSHRKHASIVGVPKFLPSFAGLRFLEEYRKLSEALNPPHPVLFILGGAKFETKLPLIEKFLEIADEIFIGGTLAVHASRIPIAKNPKIIFPVGDVAALDTNAETLEILKLKIENCKFVLWNGPLGKYEDGYDSGTKELAKIINKSGVSAVIGGGDTENVIDEIEIENPNIFVSLAGGAMLDFLVDGALPGIEALN